MSSSDESDPDGIDSSDIDSSDIDSSTSHGCNPPNQRLQVPLMGAEGNTRTSEERKDGRPVWPLHAPCDTARNFVILYIQGDTPMEWWNAGPDQQDGYVAYHAHGSNRYVSGQLIVDKDVGGIYQIWRGTKRYFATRPSQTTNDLLPWQLPVPCETLVTHTNLKIQGNDNGQWWDANERQRDWYNQYQQYQRSFQIHTDIVGKDELGIFQIRSERLADNSTRIMKRYFKPESDLLADLLSLYRYDFLGPVAGNFVREMYNNTAIRQQIHDSMTLVVPRALEDEAVIRHLRYRYLIYYGAPMHQADLRLDKMKAVLGYDYDDVQVHRPQDATLRYGILGWTPVQSHTHFGAGSAWVYHLWGVNMKQSDVDRQFVRWEEDRYMTLLNIVIGLLEQGALALKSKPGVTGVMLRTVKLGLGEWGAGLSRMHIRPKIDNFFSDKLLGLHTKHQEWLQIRLPQYPHRVTKATIEGAWVDAERNHDPFGDDPDRAGSTIIQRIPLGYTTMLVNAWDNGSLCGNGGSKDPTLDGFMVAPGAFPGISSSVDDRKGIGFNFINCSYLHNSMFAPARLLDRPETWYRDTPLPDGLVPLPLNVLEKLEPMYNALSADFRGFRLQCEANDTPFVIWYSDDRMFVQPLEYATTKACTTDQLSIRCSSDPHPNRLVFLEGTLLPANMFPVRYVRVFDGLAAHVQAESRRIGVFAMRSEMFRQDHLRLLYRYLQTKNHTAATPFIVLSGSGHPMRVWYTTVPDKDYDIFNIQGLQEFIHSTQDNKLGIALAHRAAVSPFIRSVYQNGQHLEAGPTDTQLFNPKSVWNRCLGVVMDDVFARTSTYSSVQHTITLHKEALSRQPEEHLHSFLAVAKSVHEQLGEISVTFLDGDFAPGPGVDAGGLMRQYLDTLSHALCDGHRRRKLEFDRDRNALVSRELQCGVMGSILSTQEETKDEGTDNQVLLDLGQYWSVLAQSDNFVTGRMFPDDYLRHVRTLLEYNTGSVEDVLQCAMSFEQDDGIIHIITSGQVDAVTDEQISRLYWSCESMQKEWPTGPDEMPLRIQQVGRYALKVDLLREACRSMVVESVLDIVCTGQAFVRGFDQATATMFKHDVVKASECIQGLAFDRERIAADIRVTAGTMHAPVINQKVDWLREWITDATQSSQQAVERLLMAVTGTRTMIVGQGMRFTGSVDAMVHAHTCFFLLEVPGSYYRDGPEGMYDAVAAGPVIQQGWRRAFFTKLEILMQAASEMDTG